jgi:hypothetical protein
MFVLPFAVCSRWMVQLSERRLFVAHYLSSNILAVRAATRAENGADTENYRVQASVSRAGGITNISQSKTTKLY